MNLQLRDLHLHDHYGISEAVTLQHVQRIPKTHCVILRRAIALTKSEAALPQEEGIWVCQLSNRSSESPMIILIVRTGWTDT